jgi:hypothetical protein
MTESLSQARYDDWIVRAALLPALLTLAGVGITTAIAWRNQTFKDPATLSAIHTDSDADDYVQGLAKLGIVQMPSYHPQPALPPPALPAYELPPTVDLVSHR